MSSQFVAREVCSLPLVQSHGWNLKQYAIRAAGRELDNKVLSCAQDKAIEQLSTIDNDNHGAGFQIIHFAETAVVSPVFYWKWGSVLCNTIQLRSDWSAPRAFTDGFSNIIGCVWEMQIVNAEVEIWQQTMMSGDANSFEENLGIYLETSATIARV